MPPKEASQRGLVRELRLLNNLLDIQGGVGNDKEEIRYILEELNNIILEKTRAGEKVCIQGFGVYTPRLQTSRLARNPKSGETLMLIPRTIVHFKCAPNLLTFIHIVLFFEKFVLCSVVKYFFLYCKGDKPVCLRKKRPNEDWFENCVFSTISWIFKVELVSNPFNSRIIYSVIQSLADLPLTSLTTMVKYLGVMHREFA